VRDVCKRNYHLGVPATASHPDSRAIRLATILRHAWAPDTASDPERWSRRNPARGQCAVTALIVQDQLGGSLMRAHVEGESHYWNLLPSGEHLDLTREQFSEPVKVTNASAVDRDYVLSYEDTRRRYERLRARAHLV